MRSRLTVALVAIIAAITVLPVGNVAHASASCAGASTGGDWSKYGQDLNNNRNQTSSSLTALQAAALKSGFVLDVSSLGANGTFAGTPIVTDGCLYVATNTGFVVAVNADTGESVWTTKLPAGVTSLSSDQGRLYANISAPNAPKIAGLDQATGAVLWTTQLDDQQGSEVTGSPTAFNGMVITGFSGAGAEVSGPERVLFRGGFSILDGASGTVLKKTYTIDDASFAAGFAGGGVWSTPAIDTEAQNAYFGTGNPFGAHEHANTNAIIRVDVNPSNSTFGEITDSYKGRPDQYLDVLGTFKPVCAVSPSLGSCELLDLDFGASPSLFTVNGQKMVGDLQKSGIYHAVDASTMDMKWETVVSGPIAGGNAASPAYDGTNAIVSATEVLASTSNGTAHWTVPGAGSGYNTPSVANGVVYTAVNGMLHVISASTGAPIGSYPISGTALPQGVSLDGGVALARNNVYANNGSVIVSFHA